MKKLVWILVALVIVLGGLLIFEYLNDSEETRGNVITEESRQPIEKKNETYNFQDVESMKKAKTLEEAFDKIIGKERLIHNKNTYEVSALFPFDMKPGYDTRMEMIDLLHYIQHSGLIENRYGDPYSITMSVYQPIKSGMTRQDPHQRWGISTEDVKVMDFSDKKTMLGEIHRYGKFEGVNPSGMN